MNVTKFGLRVVLESVTGCGDGLTFKVKGHRKKKSGNYEHYEIDLHACRYAVTRLMREMREMHKRDRRRIAYETARIAREIQELTSGNT